jgi:lipopolysaccharide biosynthesis regulator YciM
MENTTGNIILNAALSQLVSERDSYVVSMDMILNKSTEYNPNIVSELVKILKKLSKSETTIELVKQIIEDNKPNKENMKILNKVNKHLKSIKEPKIK